MKEASKLVFELKAVVEEYLEKHPHISLHALSKRCGVASTTLRRIVNLETRENPNPLTVLGIVSAITRENRIEVLLENFNGEIKASLERCYAPAFHSARSVCRTDIGELLSDREIYVIYKLAGNRVGTSEKEITDLLGLPAKQKIDQLIDSELIYSKEGRLYTYEKVFSVPINIAKQNLPELLRFTYSKGKYVDRSIFLSISESVNKKAYDEIWSILKEASLKVADIVGSEKSVGEIPFFYTCVLDTMDVDADEE